MRNGDILFEIFNNLEKGIKYGKDVTNVTYPYFSKVLYKTMCGNIGYSRYGSSAVKMTLSELAWVIMVMFEMTPAEFITEYKPHTESALY